MKTVSVRDLRYNFPAVEKMLAEGEEIEITKRKRVIATLGPPKPPRKRKIPDFMGRMKAIFGDRVLERTAAEVLREERDSRW